MLITSLPSAAKINATTSATLSGAVSIRFFGGPVPGVRYTLITSAAVTGSFDQVVTSPSEISGHLEYTPTAATFVIDNTDVIFSANFERDLLESLACSSAFDAWRKVDGNN